MSNCALSRRAGGVDGQPPSAQSPSSSAELADNAESASFLTQRKGGWLESGIRPRNSETSRNEDRLRRASVLCLGFEEYGEDWWMVESFSEFCINLLGHTLLDFALLNDLKTKVCKHGNHHQVIYSDRYSSCHFRLVGICCSPLMNYFVA